MSDLINLLLIDDNQNFLEILHEQFKDHGYSIRSVETIEAAEEILTKFEVDTIICDYNLRGSTGIDLLRNIRKKGLQTPFILISGDITSDLIFSGLRLGAFDILDKPLDLELIVQTVLHAINCGIQYRTLQERIRSKISPEEAKLMLQSLKMTSMLRFANHDSIQWTTISLADVS